MALNKGKHLIGEIDGTRCTIVDSGVTLERANFLKELLEHNKLVVKMAAETKKNPEAADTYIVGVTDLIFNPVINIYKKKLFRKDGKIVTPAYWSQDIENSNKAYYMVGQ